MNGPTETCLNCGDTIPLDEETVAVEVAGELVGPFCSDSCADEYRE